MTYVLITMVVLLFLNIYCTNASEKIFSESKKALVFGKASMAAQEVSAIEVLNPETAASAVAKMENLDVNRLIITDHNGLVMYDSLTDNSLLGSYLLFPEVIVALEGNDVFTWFYENGVMESRAATPIMSYDTLIGSVYLLEVDLRQGELMDTLQRNIFTISLLLEVLVVIFSLIFSKVFSQRMRKILASVRIIRSGDYSHKLELSGRDELNLLGDEFNELSDRLQESEQRRRQFVSDASHELKTPLASIKLLSDSILQNDMDAETIREFVGDIGNEADRLNRLSQKLIYLTKLDNETDSGSEIVYIGPTIHKVVRMLSAVADYAGVTLHADILQDCPILILEDDLYQIIFNLVENGIKYNISGGQLTIMLTRRDEDAVLQIRDSGVGIPEESLEHIFERFYRVDKARSRQTGGSGLGLAIVHDMVERNRGQIYVSSVEGQGTIFTVEFPVFDPDEEVYN